MEQHAIPQQISSYEFKLVGDMTLKQFLKAAVGIIIAILIRSTKLLAIFKWPLMFASAGLGLALAFVPFQDRPLETWVVSFLRSIYAPTIYTYKKKNEDWLELTSVDTREDEEKRISNKNENLFVMKKNNEDDSIGSHLTINTKTRKTLKTDTTVEEKKQMKIVSNDNQTPQKVVEKNEEKTVPKNEESSNVNTDDWKSKSVDLGLKKEKLEATGAAVFGNIPMPDRPEAPNLIVGMATDNEGKIVDSVIVEIQDAHGNPIRVIKTNALGQFKISTPLANGRYLVIAEKDGYIFDRVNIDLGGKIVEPIRIIAHK
jgi:hypothetical protein